jgi:hypothetical protein
VGRYIDRLCGICEKLFSPTHGLQKYCCDYCRGVAARRCGHQPSYKHAPDRAKVVHWVYVIGYGSRSKIGYSIDPDKRLRELQTGCPERLTLYKKYGFAIRSRAKYMEKKLHLSLAHKYKFFRVGEWFHVSPEKAIEAINQIFERMWKKDAA